MIHPSLNPMSLQLTIRNFSDFCVQSSLVWQQIYAEDRTAVFQEPWDYYQNKHNFRLLKVRYLCFYASLLSFSLSLTFSLSFTFSLSLSLSLFLSL